MKQKRIKKDRRRANLYRHFKTIPPSYFKGLKRTCQKTGMFDSEEEAIAAADDYNKRILFANMNAYHCPRHQCWHIGHWDKNGQAWTTNPPGVKTE